MINYVLIGAAVLFIGLMLYCGWAEYATDKEKLRP